MVQETTTRSYDLLDRLETETRYDTKQTTYGYDAKGNRTRVADFQGVDTTYTFDGQDRLQTAVTAEGTTTYGYFPDGLAKSTAFFNGTYEGRCYDDAGRLTALVTARAPVANACAQPQPPFVSRQQYTHDAEGNRLTQVEELTVAGGAAPGSAETTEYGYDEESRLVGVRYPDNTAALYQLDAVGNRVGERKAVAGLVPALTAAAFLAVSPAALTNDVVAVFNRADWLESVTDSRAPAKDATFEWDAAGNLTRQQTAARDRRFTWDVKQTLTKVEDNGIESGRYDYGADGLRSKRVTSLESVEYVLDGMQVLVETDGAVSAHPAKRRYHYASAALAVTDISGATRTTKALHLDALGSPATETTQTGVVAAVRQYDAWGLYRNGTAPGSTDAKLGYTGHQYDPETGLVYARARYYDAEYGRFLSRDSVEGQLNSAPSLHRFAYGSFNPLRYSDLTGHCFWDDYGCLQALYDLNESLKPQNMVREVSALFAPDPVRGADERLQMGALPSAREASSVYAPKTAAGQARKYMDAVVAGSDRGTRRQVANWQAEQTGAAYLSQHLENRSLGEAMADEASEAAGLYDMGAGATRESKTLQGMSQQEADFRYARGLAKAADVGMTVALPVGLGIEEVAARRAAEKLAVREGEVLIIEGGNAPPASDGIARIVTRNADPVDAHLARRSGELISKDPVATRAYAQIQQAGFEVELEFGEAPARTSGMTWPGKGSVQIFARNTGSAAETVSTMIHESSHVRSVQLGRPTNTLLDEYRAFRREALFQKGGRPTLGERKQIFEQVEKDYPDLPVGGKVPDALK